MESLPTTGKQPSVFHEPSHQLLFDGLSWLDADDDLDLRLRLDDDYHVDLKTSKPLTNPSPPPLFLRRLSTNKLSFGRSSVSSSRPTTKDSSFPQQPPVPQPHHARRKSRALSLITPKHGPQASITSIDLAAAHYQDPEARHKLRVYSSPQMFDEALRFGFPSNNAHPAILPREVPRRSRSFSRDLFNASSEKLKTFLADDSSSIYSQDSSISDSESPRTPHTPERLPQAIQPFHLPGHGTTLPSKLSEAHAQDPAESREMTLRMTLTRPDLRSCQEELYASRKGVCLRQPSRSSQLAPFRADKSALAPDTKDATKESMDRIFADIDRELGSSTDGVVKRFWNRVRRS
jgi:hypothetical protein